MLLKNAAYLLVFGLFFLAESWRVAEAAELFMIEQQGCVYCEQWDAEVAPEYPKTAEGRAAPLHRLDINEAPPEGVTFARMVTFTPTFILIENGKELGRIEGYPGEAFFWGLLDNMLQQNSLMKEGS